MAGQPVSASLALWHRKPGETALDPLHRRLHGAAGGCGQCSPEPASRCSSGRSSAGSSGGSSSSSSQKTGTAWTLSPLTLMLPWKALACLMQAAAACLRSQKLCSLSWPCCHCRSRSLGGAQVGSSSMRTALAASAQGGKHCRGNWGQQPPRCPALLGRLTVPVLMPGQGVWPALQPERRGLPPPLTAGSSTTLQPLPPLPACGSGSWRQRGAASSSSACETRSSGCNTSSVQMGCRSAAGLGLEPMAVTPVVVAAAVAGACRCTPPGQPAASMRRPLPPLGALPRAAAGEVEAPDHPCNCALSPLTCCDIGLVNLCFASSATVTC